MGTPIPLTSGAYSSQSRIASAQRCLNLYPEKNPDNIKPPMPFTHYPRPGLKLLSSPPLAGRARCLYCSTKGNQGGLINGSPKGDLFAVIDQTVYFINTDWTWSVVGMLVSPGNTPVSMADNGQSILAVDGTPQGYEIPLDTRLMVQVADPNFTGADRVDFLDSFITFNVPNTSQWGSTLSGEVSFNPLYVGVKTAWPDNIICVITNEREALILGPKKGEVWFNAGAVPFPFQILPNIIIEQGCSAKYSPAKIDTNICWLSESPEGDRMVMRMNSQNVAERISTHAIEVEWRKYPRVDDAIGAVYQIAGHEFYKITFPTADKTWGVDLATGQWHEDAWIDTNGILHRARNTFCAFAYGKNVALDWATGNLYQLDPDTYTDEATFQGGGNAPIAWIRSFPHVENELLQVSHSAVTADVETGSRIGTGEVDGTFASPWSSGFSSGFGPLTQIAVPNVVMRYSKDGGRRFSNNRPKTLTSSGHYRSMMRWRGMGIARDMVYEFSSTVEMCGALNGAYVEVMPGTS